MQGFLAISLTMAALFSNFAFAVDSERLVLKLIPGNYANNALNVGSAKKVKEGAAYWGSIFPMTEKIESKTAELIKVLENRVPQVAVCLAHYALSQQNSSYSVKIYQLEDCQIQSEQNFLLQ